jgi:hypothetical protein
VLSLHAIYHYKIATSFAVGDEISYKRLASICGLNEIDLRRILRYAMTFQVFSEPREGVIIHTAASRLLAEDAQLRDLVGAVCEEKFPASARVELQVAPWAKGIAN